jgi:glycerophosphoryl diester phosphodiesterase
MRLPNIMALIDRIMEFFPRHPPAASEVEKCRIIAHRGAHAPNEAIENTLNAFDRALFAGAWGIEFDVRWTMDLKPLVFHDETFLRLYNDPSHIGALTENIIRKRFPLVPTLEEVVNRYGQKMHMMIELKEAPDDTKNDRLKYFLGHLAPIEDYHILSLTPGYFDRLEYFPPKSFLPVAQTNTRQMSRLAIEKGYAGVAGHYLLVTDRIKRNHIRVGQAVGTGYIGSRNCLWLQIRRKIHWIFTNDLVRMLEVRNAHTRKKASSNLQHGTGGNEQN